MIQGGEGGWVGWVRGAKNKVCQVWAWFRGVELKVGELHVGSRTTLAEGQIVKFQSPIQQLIRLDNLEPNLKKKKNLDFSFFKLG